MAHLSIAPTKGATSLTPLSATYTRSTKDGAIDIVDFLLGSHYNVKIDGEMSITSSGNITNDSAKAINGKLELAAQSVDGSTVEKTASFNSFMAFFPSTRIFGHLELQDASDATTPIQKVSYTFEDLATNDQIIVSLETGATNAILKFEERVNGTVTNLATQNLTAGVKEVEFEIDFLVDAITSFRYKEIPNGTQTRIFNGTLKADIFEAKVLAKLTLNQQVTKTVKSDLLWIMYPTVFVGYTIPNIGDKTKGRIRIFDDMNDPDESNWVEVFSPDHQFTGLRVIENGMIRIKFLTDPAMEVFGWDDVALTWNSIGKVVPVSSGGLDAVTLADVIFERFNNGFIKIIVKYGIVDHIVSMRRGLPTVRIKANSQKISVKTSKARFALSVDDTATQIPDFNQKNSDDANRGNPLNLSPTNNPFIFTDDTNPNTGLDLIDDNWFAWYNLVSNDMIGYLGISSAPTGLTVKALSATQLERIDWTFDKDFVGCVGILKGDMTATVNGVPVPFSIGSIDQYVKWRANEGLYWYNQRGFLRRKR